MKRYEGLFILETAGKEEGIKDTIDKISAEITSLGGKVETVQKMEKKSFIRVADKKHSAGYYVNIIFESQPSADRPVEAPLCHERGCFPGAVHQCPGSETSHHANCRKGHLWPTSTKSFSRAT